MKLCEWNARPNNFREFFIFHFYILHRCGVVDVVAVVVDGNIYFVILLIDNFDSLANFKMKIYEITVCAHF